MKEITAPEYAKLAKPSSFMQTPEMAKQRKAQNQTVHFFKYKDEFALLNGTPYSTSKYLNYNAWFSDHLSEKFIHDLRLWCKNHKGLSLTITPNIPIAIRDHKGNHISKHKFDQTPYSENNFTRQPLILTAPGTYKQWQYIINLDKSHSELLKSFKPKVRHGIATTEKTGIYLEKLTSKNLKAFTKTLASTADRRHFSSRDEKYYKSMLDSFGANAYGLLAYIDPAKTRKLLNTTIKNSANLKDGADIIKKAKRQLALVKDLESPTPIYAGFFVSTPRETVYLAGGGPDEFFPFSPVYAILNQAIKTSVDQKIERFNFYGVDATFEHPTGLLRFKQQFNGFIEQLPGDYTTNLRPLTNLKLKAQNRLKKR